MYFDYNLIRKWRAYNALNVNLMSPIMLTLFLSCTAFNLDFYTDVMDLTYLLDHLAADPFFKKFHHLNEKLAEVIQDYGLVSFVPLNVQVRLARDSL